ncbi:hypothetical protein L9F63_001968 [Diploptera punctata]|uniref:Uncharacterized protein n=1 Tax=Diploptera punctata TaxID=6984 RepID=A0AAD8A496_DIPPU|nr:hypothetical protein L9F63_001968 [Diploptera punctata]
MLSKKFLDEIPQRKSPLLLEELAFDAISTFVGNIMQRILLTHCTKRIVDLNCTEVFTTVTLDLSMLENYLHSNFPRVLAAKMTSHLLKGIGAIVDTVACSNDSFKTTGDTTCKHIVSQFIISSINAHLTCVDMSKEPYLIRKVLSENLNKIPKLEILSIRAYDKWNKSKNVILRNLCSLENLVCFNMKQDCTDDVIMTLVQNCRKLKSLIANGSVNLTNACIVSLLQLQDLEQLELCTTRITEVGYCHLFTKMAQNKNFNTDDDSSHGTPLKIVGCSLIKNGMLEILLKHSNLKVVSLSSLFCDLSLLKDLKFLEQLKLEGGHFLTDNIKGLIQEKGSSLYLLELFLIQDIDLQWLGKYCTELKNLSIRSCTFSSSIPLSGRSSKVVAFRKVEELVFYVQCTIEYIYFLLVNCINIRKVTVGLIKPVNDAFIADILSQNPMKQLEEFSVYFSDLTLKKCSAFNEKLSKFISSWWIRIMGNFSVRIEAIAW